MQPRRIKTYTAETGFVYQYYFVGHRPVTLSDPAAPGREYVFDVTSDRNALFAVSVLVTEGAVSSWAEQHGRSLVDAERYAAAKVRMLRAFDEIADMKHFGRRLVVDLSELEELLAGIGVD